MTFKALASQDRWYGLGAAAALLLLDGLLVRAVLGRPVDGLSFVLVLCVLASLLAVAYLVYRTVGIYSLEYWVDRDGVTVIWGPTRQVIPMGQIRRVVLNSAARPLEPPRLWHWPCASRRRVVCESLGVVNSYATRPLGQQVIVETAAESYGLTPSDVPGFLEALQVRYALGAARTLRAELRRPPLWTWSLWRDRSAFLLMGVALLGVLLMFGVLCFRFPTLSSDLPLHFDVNGLPDRISPKTGLFALPIIGLLTWSLNLLLAIWLYRRLQRSAAYLLWGGAVVVVGIAGLALFNLMRW